MSIHRHEKRTELYIGAAVRSTSRRTSGNGLPTVKLAQFCSKQTATNEGTAMTNTARYWSTGFAIGLAVIGSAVACSSTGESVFEPAQTDGGSSSGWAAQLPEIRPGAGSAGMSMPTGGTPAQDTHEGIELIPPAKAAALENPAEMCAGWSESAKGQPSVLEFVVDVSGSMREKTDSTNGDSKWEVTRRALASAIAGLPPSIAVGTIFFPNMISHDSDVPVPLSDCLNTEDNVAIAPLTAAQRSALTKALDHVEPKTLGATPTHDGVILGVSELKTTTLAGQRYVVLITDGQPTLAEGCLGVVDMCSPQPTAPIVQAIANAHTQGGVRTFVVGSPGSEANVCTGADVRGWLSEAARAGGTGTAGCSDQGNPYCHFDISIAPDLDRLSTTALGTIAVSVVSCEYDVPAPSAVSPSTRRARTSSTTTGPTTSTWCFRTRTRHLPATEAGALRMRRVSTSRFAKPRPYQE